MNLDLVNRAHGKRSNKYDIHGQSFIQQLRQEQFNNRYSLTERKQQYDALNDPYTSYYFSNPSVKMHLKTFRRAIREEPNQKQKRKLSHLISKRITEKFKEFVCPKTLVYQQQMTPIQLSTLIKKSSASLKHKKSKQSLASYSSNEDSKSKGNSLPRRYFPSVKLQATPKASSQNPHTFVEADPQQPQKADLNCSLSTKKPNKVKLNDEILTEKGSKLTQSPDQTSKLHTEANLEKQLLMKSSLKDAQQKVYANKLAEQLHRKKHQKWLQFLSQKKTILSQIKPLQAQNQGSQSEKVHKD